VAVRCCRRPLRHTQSGGDGSALVDVALNGGPVTANVYAGRDRRSR
jgi:hypothetical protein